MSMTIRTCPKCATRFQSSILPIANKTLPFPDFDLLCTNCANVLNSNSKYKVVNDYYFDENGNTVFTADYHLKRGYCCRNNCRHCPY
jgi:hypothetical protein